MPNPKYSWLPAEVALDIHSRLLEDDPVAPSELAEVFLDQLAEWLERINPTVDPHTCATAAEDAILALIKNPSSYNPTRQSLDAYLRMSATGDLKNALRAEHRHGKRRASLVAVELSPVDRNSLWDHTDPAKLAEREALELEIAARLSPQSIPEQVRSNLTAQEFEVLLMMQTGERKTVDFAQVLGIQHLPEERQRAEVKRIKDRLKRRMQRAERRDD